MNTNKPMTLGHALAAAEQKGGHFLDYMKSVPPYSNIPGTAQSPLPFHLGRISGKFMAVYGPKGEQVADCSGMLPDDEAQANAAFIVRACNSHAALVEAVSALLKYWPGEKCERLPTDDGFDWETLPVIRLAESALQSAKE